MRIFIIILVMSTTCIIQCQNHMVFCDNVAKATSARNYAQVVQDLPICCVDIFVYNPNLKSYFLVLRKQKPVQGIWWYPGGRLFKGESFFECAQRKCKQEAGLDIEPVIVLDSYSTIFPDSEWNCQTHTINIAVFALCVQNELPDLDGNHEQWQWQPIDKWPEHPYLHDIYLRVLKYIK
jgi:colanic acid biosynthesis protein WcaH